MQVENMISKSSGCVVANQYLIHTSRATVFQSYDSIIAVRFGDGRKTVLDEKYWDYSSTTGKYRNQFLGENIAETRKKIKDGTYVLANLQGVLENDSEYRDEGVCWAIAELMRNGEDQSARALARTWGFNTTEDLLNACKEEFDREELKKVFA